MAIVRYNPWSELDSVQRQINRMFNEGLPTAALTELSSSSNYPKAELVEAEEHLTLRLEVPGLKAENLEIEATVKSVSIKGERQQPTEADRAKTRSEFSYGSFQRVISLPVRIQNTAVKAEYQDGILELTLPKADEEKNKVVKVNLLSESNG